MSRRASTCVVARVARRLRDRSHILHKRNAHVCTYSKMRGRMRASTRSFFTHMVFVVRIYVHHRPERFSSVFSCARDGRARRRHASTRAR